MNTALVLIAAILTAGPAPATDGRRVGQGAAPGVADAAIEEAAAAAKRTIVADFINAKTGMEDLSPFAAILDRAAAYVHSAEVVSRYETAGGTRVELAAALFEEDLERDMLRLLEVRAREPAPILVLLAEPSSDSASAPLREPPSESSTTQLLAKAIEEAGCRPLTLDDAAATPAEAAALAAGEAEALANLGAAHFAEAVAAAVLTLEAAPRENTANIVTLEAQMELRLVQVRTGTLCEHFKVQRRIHCAAPGEAAELLREDCIEAVKDRLRRALLFATAQRRPADEVQIELDTGAAPNAATLLRSLLAQFPLVEEVEMVLDAPRLSRLRMRYNGPLAPLTDTLVAMALDEGVFLDVRRVVGNDVAIAAAPLQDTN